MNIKILHKYKEYYKIHFENDWLSDYHVYIYIDKLIIFDTFGDDYEYTSKSYTENENVKFLLNMSLQERNNYFENLLIINKFKL